MCYMGKSNWRSAILLITITYVMKGFASNDQYIELQKEADLQLMQFM